jgi:hypothetical protein
MDGEYRVQCAECGSELFAGDCEEDGATTIVVSPCDCRGKRIEFDNRLNALDAKADELARAVEALSACKGKKDVEAHS